MANSNLLSFGSNPDTATTLNRIIASLGNFAWTKLCLLIALLFQVLWAFAKSHQGEGKPEFKGLGYNFLRYWLQITAIVAFCELQPFILDALKSTYGPSNIPAWIDKLAKFATQVTPYMASLAALVAFASKFFGDEIKVQAGKKGFASTFKWLLSKSILVIAALALPIVIWGIYLRTTLWGYTRYQDWPYWLTQPINDFCYQSKPETWGKFCSSVKGAPLYTIATVFLVIGGGILLLSWKFLTPNTNSLHRLYRDRLSEAFLVDPTEVSQQRMNDADAKNAFSLDAIKLSSLAANFAPVHLSNAALNIQGSEFANKRGRNADFFFFSQAYSGSRATGFIKTSELERTVPELDVATIMAISGAAASSNMGSNTVWGFAPTLALLNIRLGFWMRNPNSIVPNKGNATFKSKTPGTLYLIKEMFSKLNETDDAIYLTDGGHIENLGLYELLRRRCKHIIVVDAEADPSMSFRSLVDVERYARIDLGIRIDLPWQTTRNSSLEIDGIFSSGKRPTAKHPHVAIGTVDYGSGAKATLVYIKSSLPGDENDYILDYKARYSAFPHETTSDQFFSEEQFEVYRALGFHAAHGAFNGKSYVEGREHLPKKRSTAKGSATRATLKSLFT